MRKIKKGDKVVVLTGRDKGKSGEVLEVRPTEGRAVVPCSLSTTSGHGASGKGKYNGARPSASSKAQRQAFGVSVLIPGQELG